ncbi:Cytochrome c oxidase subunit 5A, partial [Ascosphaera pollenicola]
MSQKITAKIAALRNDEPYFSLEFFPPKTQIGFANLTARLERMSQALHPLFVTVTWGAGGTTASKSLELADICQRQLQLTTVLHLTCTNSSRRLIDETLAAAKGLGIRNILALRGDPPRSEEYVRAGDEQGDDSNAEFRYAVDLVRYIRREYGDWFDIGVAAYPEGHADESHPRAQDPEQDLPYLIEKTAAGADFIMTQLTYDVDAYTRFERRLMEHESGVFKSIPIIPGLMPIQSYNNLTRVTKLSHVHVSEEMLEKLKAVRADDETVKRIGVDLLCDIVKGIQQGGHATGPRGFHFYTLNLEKSVTKILERCNLLRPDQQPTTSSSTAAAAAAAAVAATTENQVILDHPDSNPTAQSHEITPSSISLSALTLTDPSTQHDTILQISEGVGSLGREATWDDFPNGRWGDPRSPAFGEIDGYGPSLHVGPNEARKLWGYPVDKADISALFLKHIKGDLSVVPWSEGGGGDLQE